MICLKRFLLLSCIVTPFFHSLARADDQPAQISTTQPSLDLASPASRPSDTDLPDRFAQAKAAYQASTQACLDKLRQSADYQTALANLETAKQNRAAATGDSIPAAAQDLIQARTAVSTLERDALAHDPSIAAAKREMDAAAAAEGGIRLAVLPRLNRAILVYAEQSVGKVIGNGECWTLGHEAVESAGARQVDAYVWGRELGPKETVLPGDIMQFTSCKLQGPRWSLTLGLPNHTAIVQKVEGTTVFWILGQNPGPVVARRVDFQYLVSGSYKIYRPLPE